MTAPTPRPWRWDRYWLTNDNGDMVLWYTTDDDGIHAKPPDAAFIVRAVNSFDAMQHLAQTVIDLYGCATEHSKRELCELARAALKLAEAP